MSQQFTNLGRPERAADQQQMGAHLHLEVLGAIADLPGQDSGHTDADRAELLERAKRLQERRALHNSRARNLLGLHDLSPTAFNLPQCPHSLGLNCLKCYPVQYGRTNARLP